MNEWHSKILVIIPTYNESENILALLGRLRNLPGNINALVVDDNSPDGTGVIVDATAEVDTGIHALHRPSKLGLGTAHMDGFRHGLQQGYDYLCTMDADFSHSPESLPSLLDKAAAGSDLVIGSRYVTGGTLVGTTKPRRLVSWGANALAHIFLGVAAHDCTAGFRCYRRRVLETINLDTIFSNGYSFLIEMTFYCQKAGFRIDEVPITFVNRQEGKSKISSLELLKAFYTVLRLSVLRLVQRAP